MVHAFRIGSLAVVLLLLGCSLALAHKINVFATVEGDVIHVESYFSDGRPVKASRVKVYDSSDTLVYEGRTDDSGQCSFPVPKVDRLNIVVREILGHQNSFTLEKEEIEAARSQR